MTVFVLAITLVGVSVIGMAISVLLKKEGKFPELHISKNEEMKKRGVSCVSSQDREARCQNGK